MGSYIPATGEERQAMLQAIGLTSVDELFDVVPEAVRVKNLDLPEGLSEWEASQTWPRRTGSFDPCSGGPGHTATISRPL